MTIPVGAYVASHLAAQRMRKQNNSGYAGSGYGYTDFCKKNQQLFYFSQWKPR